jgi:hypothetical protein
MLRLLLVLHGRGGRRTFYRHLRARSALSEGQLLPPLEGLRVALGNVDVDRRGPEHAAAKRARFLRRGHSAFELRPGV